MYNLAFQCEATIDEQQLNFNACQIPNVITPLETNAKLLSNFITLGGHGKRSDVPHVGLSLELPQDYSNTNKEIVVSSIILLLLHVHAEREQK